MLKYILVFAVVSQAVAAEPRNNAIAAAEHDDYQQVSSMAVVEFGRIVEKELSDSRYQTELPSAPSSTQTDILIEPPQGSGEAVRLLLWLVVIVGGTLLVFWFATLSIRHFRQLKSHLSAIDDEESSVRNAAIGSDGDGALGEADRLARQGRYGEAVRALLLLSFNELQHNADHSLSQSLTSREILTSAKLTTDAQASLGFLVQLVELTHFGGRVCGELEYRKGRESYQQLCGLFEV